MTEPGMATNKKRFASILCYQLNQLLDALLHLEDFFLSIKLLQQFKKDFISAYICNFQILNFLPSVYMIYYGIYFILLVLF